MKRTALYIGAALLGVALIIYFSYRHGHQVATTAAGAGPLQPANGTDAAGNPVTVNPAAAAQSNTAVAAAPGSSIADMLFGQQVTAFENSVANWKLNV